MTQDWTMPRHGDACAACGRSFDIGEAFAAYLFESAAGYARRDQCCACPAPAEAPLATWKTRRPAPAARSAPPLDRDALLGFLDRLGDDVDPARRQLRFVIALLLWRKRVLKFVGSILADSAEWWEFSSPRSPAPLRIARPPIEESELERLSLQLEALIAGAVPADEPREPVSAERDGAAPAEQAHA